MESNHLSFEELLDYLLSQGKEGEFWDFKREWHSKIEDLIKDIICFANTVHDKDCYLIFGIEDDLSIIDVPEPRRKQADILDALSNLVFAGDVIPCIDVETVNYHGKTVDILVIYNVEKTPVYLKKSYGNMIQGCIYARVGDRNTPNKGCAEVDVIESLWRKRLGLTKPPLEYVIDSLKHKLEWVESETGFYHMYKPELTMEYCAEEPEISHNQDEFYSYAQTNESTSYQTMDIKAHGTTLESFQIVNLDSGRLSIPVPQWEFIKLDAYGSKTIAYKAYISGTHSEQLLWFMYDELNGDQRWAFRRFEEVVLFFKSDEEHKSFEEYIQHHLDDFTKRIKESNAFDYITTENVDKTELYKQELKAAVVLKEMLVEFRHHNE